MAKGNRPRSSRIDYTSPDHTTFNDSNPITYSKSFKGVFRKMYRRYTIKEGRDEMTIFQAKSDGNGNLTFSYAKPDYEDEPHSFGEYYNGKKIWNVKSGYSVDNVRGGTNVVGINWDNVKSASGKTYELREELKRRGFKWDTKKQSWIKK